MEITTLIIGLALGLAFGAALIYFILKSNHVSKSNFEEVQKQFTRNSFDLETAIAKRDEHESTLNQEKKRSQEISIELQNLQAKLATHLAENKAQQESLSNLRTTIETQTSDIKKLQQESIELHALKSDLAAKNENLQKLLDNQKEEIAKMQELAKNEFQNLANKILEEKTEKFTALNQTNLKTILEPLGENLENFKKRVDEVYNNEARERFSLNSTIKLMMDQTAKVSQEANNLATALKGQTKTQGDWGEMILERILEDSGLTKDREYFTQINIKNEAGENQRPDFILKLPGNQLVIIDSKVSLNAYERMTSAETDEDRKTNLALHIAAIKKHIDTLSQKKYDDLKDSLDFTIMFIPVEPAFLTAVQYDTQLWNYAYHKHIILLSPTNLIAYLKLISDVWKRADQNQNALEIAERGGKLYDKFVNFVENLEKVGKNIDTARNSYQEAFKQLATGNDNLVIQTQKLKALGAKSRKNLPTSLTDTASTELDFTE